MGTLAEIIRGMRNDVAEMRDELAALRIENEQLTAAIKRRADPSQRTETTYLNIIGAPLGLMTGKTPAGKPQSVFKNEAAIIEAMIAHHGNVRGIAKRTIEEKFAAAKRSIGSA